MKKPTPFEYVSCIVHLPTPTMDYLIMTSNNTINISPPIGKSTESTLLDSISKLISQEMHIELDTTKIVSVGSWTINRSMKKIHTMFFATVSMDQVKNLITKDDLNPDAVTVLNVQRTCMGETTHIVIIPRDLLDVTTIYYEEQVFPRDLLDVTTIYYEEQVFTTYDVTQKFILEYFGIRNDIKLGNFIDMYINKVI